MHFQTVMILMISISISAQSVSTRSGARHAAMGYSSFSVADEACLFNNVAGLALLETPALFFDYEIVPQLPGGNRTSASLALPTSAGTLGVGAFRFGDDVYSEQLLSFGFGHRLGSTSLGARLNYVQYRASGYDTHHATTFDFGGITQINEKIRVSAGIFNLTQSSIAENEPLPITLVAALAVQLDKQMLLVTEVEKKLGTLLRIKGGIEYGLASKVFFRFGFNTNPIALFTGVGTRTRKIDIDYALSYSQPIGFTHQASGTYRLKNSGRP